MTALKSGFTTGTAAAAAVKAAMLRIVTGAVPRTVDVWLPNENRIEIPVHCCELLNQIQATAVIIKNAGDDPDVTHGAQIGADVTVDDIVEDSGAEDSGNASVTILAGEGVGTVTLPGLEISPGEPAINPVPRRMIRQAAHEVLKAAHRSGHVTATIFVPAGRILAEKTLNARLGIVGGISILGTTGIVRPMSHAAYEATIIAALSVARAGGCRRAVLTTGRRSERFAQNVLTGLPDIAFIQIGDFFGMSLEAASRKGIETVVLAVMFGKAVKMAQGFVHTHAGQSTLSIEALARWATKATSDDMLGRRLSAAHTAREALSLITDACPAVIADVGRRMLRTARGFVAASTAVQGIIFDYGGKVLYNSGDFVKRPDATPTNQ